jgi:hypothetical protein
VVSTVKTKSKHSKEAVLAHFDERKVVLTEFERDHIEVIIEAVKAAVAWNREKDSKQLALKMQQTRQEAGEVYTDLSRRIDLNEYVMELFR